MKKLLSAIIILFTISCNSHTKKETGRNSPTNIKVVVLPTEDATADDGDTSQFRYPAEISVDSASGHGDQIAAYGAANRTWLAPKGWTGTGGLYTNGGIRVDIYPTGSKDSSGPYAYFTEESSAGSVDGDAAPYFPAAMEAYNAMYNTDGKDPVEIPKGLHIERASETMVVYTLPSKKGLLTKGVAFYGTNEDDDDANCFAMAKFTLPADEPEMLDFLVDWYIKKMQ